jgi:hypothetical protein
MGRTPTPLVIYVHEPWLDHEALAALRGKGHDVRALALHPGPDLILHPHAHYWHNALWAKAAYLEAALKAARARRKESRA